MMLLADFERTRWYGQKIIGYTFMTTDCVGGKQFHCGRKVHREVWIIRG